MATDKSKKRFAETSERVRCPFCNSAETRREAAFGTTLAYAQFYCFACRTPFEWIKWDEKAPQADLPAFVLIEKKSRE
ncbi:MAG: hypothetical protein ONB46_07855 [candidate division KSB1 bacterium]|nr:hypothetical protein [candidate division KSB1 bacterium]MDZ7365817.1 hypothetical protein [candidate division KSB1 bacterium]MDZ7403704.1 hypothetical protein [candidate division KSB1 bacterium]